MAQPTIWCLVINGDHKLVGSIFDVENSSRLTVSKLKKEIKRELDPVLNHLAANSFTVWRCSDSSITFDDKDNEKLQEQVSKVFSLAKVTAVGAREPIATLMLREAVVLFVQVDGAFKLRAASLTLFSSDNHITENTGTLGKHNRTNEKESMDNYGRLEKSKLVKTTPSMVAKPSKYKEIQFDDSQKILDDRPTPDLDVAPIALLYYGFGHFLDICRGHTDVPGLNDVHQSKTRENVTTFMDDMCKYYDGETERRTKALQDLHAIFHFRKGIEIARPMAASISAATSDGHLCGHHGELQFIVELKNEPAGISAIPVIEATGYVAQSHVKIDTKQRHILESSSLPCLGMTIVGKLNLLSE